MNAARLAVFVDETDRRLGTLMVGPTCYIVNYDDRTFHRTEKTIKLHHAHRTFAVVFEETEVYVRNRLNPI